MLLSDKIISQARHTTVHLDGTSFTKGGKLTRVARAQRYPVVASQPHSQSNPDRSAARTSVSTLKTPPGKLQLLNFERFSSFQIEFTAKSFNIFQKVFYSFFFLVFAERGKG